jgi:hypothetical protein
MAFIKSLAFDGGNDYVNVPDDASLDITNNLSVVAWCECGSQSSGETIIAKYYASTNNRSWILYVGSGSQKLRCIVSDDGTWHADHTKDYETIANVLTSGWHQIGFTFASGTLKIYVDGTEITSLTKTLDAVGMTTIKSGSAACILGAHSGFGSSYWTGEICNCSVWSTTCLSPTDISNLYNSGNASDPGTLSTSATLVSSWLWNETLTYDTIPDNTGSNTGTMANMASGDIVDSPFINVIDPDYVCPQALQAISPQRWLVGGDVDSTAIEDLGEQHNTMVSAYLSGGHRS